MTGPRRQVSLQVALAACLLFVGLFAALVVSVHRYVWLTNELEQEDRQQDIALARSVAQGIDRYMTNRQHLMRALADEIAGLGLNDRAALVRIVETANRRDPAFSTLLVTDRTGLAVAFAPAVDPEGRPNVGKRYGDRAWFRAAVAPGPEPAFDVVTGRAILQPTVAVAVPIPGRNGAIVGTVAGALDLEQLRRSVRELDPQRRAHLAVVDANGRVVAHASREWEREAKDLSEEGIFREARQANDGIVAYVSHFTGKQHRGAFVRVPSTHWVVWVSRGPEGHQEKLASLIRGLLISGLVAVAVAAVASLAMGPVLVRPARRLAEAARRFSERRTPDPALLPRADSPIREFRELEAGFQEMTEALRNQYDDLERRVSERTRALEHAAREAERTSARLRAQDDIRRGYAELAALLNSLDRSHILHEATRKLAASLGAPLAAVYLTEAGPEGLRLKSHAAADAGLVDTALLSAQGLPAEAARRGETVVVTPATDADRLSLRTGVGEVPVAVVAAVPLIQQDRLLGVLVVASVGPLSDDARGFLEAAARQLAVALSNAGHFESVRYQSQRLEQLNTDLRMASAAKSRFLSSMSHELRTPLNGIIGFTEVLLMSHREPLSDRQRTALEKVRTSGRHLLGLINQVLELSKIEAGRLDVLTEPINVAPLVRECLAVVEPQAEVKGLALTAPALDALPEIVQDRGKIKQILLNLLGNAVKFTAAGGVEVRTTATADALCFAVADTGPGISPDALGGIFEEFHQLEVADPGTASGTGLGLAISRRLAHLLGGSLTVESAPGQGSVFVLSVPRQFVAASATIAGRPGGDDAIPTGTPRLLVVDDNEDAVDIIRRAIADDDVAVDWVTSAADALAYARERQPRAIVLDVILQHGEDGWQILQALKADPRTREIPVLLHSVIDNPDRARRLGALDILVKPSPAGRLRATLRRFCLNGAA